MKVTTKITLSFAVIILLIGGIVVFSQISMNHLKITFHDYRTQARQSLIMANLFEDLGDARIAVLKFRLSDSDRFAEEVRSNIQEIVDAEDAINEIVENQDHRTRLIELEKQAVEYAGIFDQAKGEQAKRHQIVTQMDAIGPEVRKKLTEIMRSAYDEGDVSAAYYAGRVQEDYMLARFYGKAFLVENLTKDVAGFDQEIELAKNQANTLIQELQDPQRRQLAEEVIEGLNAYEYLFAQVVEVITTRNALYIDGLDRIGPEIIDGYDALFEGVEERQNMLGPMAVAEMDQITQTTLMVGIGIGVLAAIATLVMSRFLSTNLASVIAQMQRLSNGDTGFEIVGADRKDEIGAMGKALDTFRKKAIEVERLEAEQKEQERKQAQARHEAMVEIADKFEAKVGGVVKNVGDAAGEVNQMAAHLTDAVEQTKSQASAVASASQEASTNVQTVAAAAEQMAASVQEIASNVNEASLNAKTCASTAGASKGHLGSLQTAVAEIDSVIQSINDVAEQTNLLALNATIEAARAGDAGKGFAVVATEVKALASQTHQMTDEIARKVGGIQASATETIRSVENIISQISAVDEKTATISAAIEEQNASTIEISRNVQEAATGTNEVSRNINDVQDVANNSSAATEQLRGSAASLSAQSLELQNAVGAFLKEVRAG